jgi:phosphoribosyl-AMP cyclohydrolase
VISFCVMNLSITAEYRWFSLILFFNDCRITMVFIGCSSFLTTKTVISVIVWSNHKAVISVIVWSNHKTVISVIVWSNHKAVISVIVWSNHTTVISVIVWSNHKTVISVIVWSNHKASQYNWLWQIWYGSEHLNL